MQEGKHVILVLDDDPDILEALRILLEANGYIMVGAATGEEGLKVCEESDPDLIIVDLMMEEVDAGTSFVRELRAAGHAPPIYMLSSVGDSFHLSTDYAELGLSGVFQKPIDPDTLLTILKRKLK